MININPKIYRHIEDVASFSKYLPSKAFLTSRKIKTFTSLLIPVNGNHFNNRSGEKNCNFNSCGETYRAFRPAKVMIVKQKICSNYQDLCCSNLSRVQIMDLLNNQKLKFRDSKGFININGIINSSTTNHFSVSRQARREVDVQSLHAFQTRFQYGFQVLPISSMYTHCSNNE